MVQQGGDVSNMVARRAASLGAGVGLPDMSESLTILEPLASDVRSTA